MLIGISGKIPSAIFPALLSGGYIPLKLEGVRVSTYVVTSSDGDSICQGRMCLVSMLGRGLSHSRAFIFDVRPPSGGLFWRFEWQLMTSCPLRQALARTLSTRLPMLVLRRSVPMDFLLEWRNRLN
jgi:hypothetical protein